MNEIEFSDDWVVRAKTSAPEDVKGAQLAERILNDPAMKRVYQRARKYALETGVMPDDKMMLHWMRDEA